jgi:hypothetical protein
VVKHTYVDKDGRSVREYTEEKAFQSIGSRFALGLKAVSMPLHGLVYFLDHKGHVWSIYEFEAV